MSFWREAPPPDELMKMEPEELAPFILRYLQKQKPGSINRYNFSLVNDHELAAKLDYTAQKKYGECLMEAWMYLERQGFIAPQPGQQGDWCFVTRKGQKVVEAQDFNSYRQAYLLQEESLDPVLAQRVRQSFASGDYETAVFQAFKEVEVRVRKKAGLTDSDIGVELMQKAFKVDGGILTNKSADRGEQVALMELFKGAIGTCKNPSSHRNVAYGSREAADVIHLANHLLRIVDSI